MKGLGSKSPESETKGGSKGYNDDAFGFVFLVGGVAAQDEVFMACFGAFSAVAAAGTALGKLDDDPRIPSLVAGAAVAAKLATLSLGIQPASTNPSALSYEVAVCCVSIAWGLWQGRGRS
jgi:hypothetical protein